MSTQIIAQPKEFIARFVALAQGRPEFGPWGNFTAIGLVRENVLIAGVVYKDFEAANVSAHIGAIHGKRWMTREYLRAMFSYPFEQLGKRRLTALIAKRNRGARKFAENLGFVYEGCLKHYYPADDMIVYGMLRENCRFIGRPLPSLMEAA